jgi:hypothetical protein
MLNETKKLTPIEANFIFSDGVGIYKTNSYCRAKPFK